MGQEYFSVALSSNVNLAIPLNSMGAVIQVEAQNICLIPGVADFWHGTINFKGSLLWVLDSDRYFKLDNTSGYFNKYTAVVIQQDRSQSSKKIALVAKKLLGIVALNSENSAQLAGDSSVLEQCCSSINQEETKRIFILNPSNLFERLYQNSTLVSA